MHAKAAFLNCHFCTKLQNCLKMSLCAIPISSLNVQEEFVLKQVLLRAGRNFMSLLCGAPRLGQDKKWEVSPIYQFCATSHTYILIMSSFTTQICALQMSKIEKFYLIQFPSKIKTTAWCTNYFTCHITDYISDRVKLPFLTRVKKNQNTHLKFSIFLLGIITHRWASGSIHCKPFFLSANHRFPMWGAGDIFWPRYYLSLLL